MLKTRQLPQVIFFIMIIMSAILGVLFVKDYGLSWDEISEREYGWDSLGAYSGRFVDWEEYNLRKYYGPFFLMVSNIISSRLEQLGASWTLYEYGHLINYVVFLTATVALYVLLRQFVSISAAVIISILFLSQPLLLGHSFINHKDIPFMSFFLISFTFGLVALRRLPDKGIAHPGQDEVNMFEASSFPAMVREDWRKASPGWRVAYCIGIGLIFIFILDMYVTNVLLYPSLERLVMRAYSGEAWTPINTLFNLVAVRASDIPLEAYLAKLSQYFGLLRVVFTVVGLILMGMLTSWFSPRMKILLWDEIVSGGTSRWWHAGSFLLILLSGILSGLATSIRLLGLLAYFLVGVLALYRDKHRALFPLTIGFLGLLFSMLLTWPALWASPWSRFIESLTLASRHPWRGVVLYRGDLYTGGTLPWHYVPSLMLSQFTEPVYVLLAAGIFAGWVSTKIDHRIDLLAVVTWFLLPVGWALLSGAIVFDNFRQFLFTIPPIFILAGIGLEHVLVKFRKNNIALVALISLILLPGLVSIVRLHPYQYIYYNGFVGGVHGAFRKYELDYWCTSYRDATNYINENLPPGSELAAWGPDRTVDHYVRDDIKTMKISESTDPESYAGMYTLACVRQNVDLHVSTNRSLIYETVVLDLPLSRVYGVVGE